MSPIFWTLASPNLKKIIETNLVGAFLCTKHAARVMIPNHCGIVVYTGSSATSIAGTGPYAKHGLVGLMRTAAVELGHHGIRANCVSPFAVLTPMLRGVFNTNNEGCREMFSSKELPVLCPEDVAYATLFMARDESKVYKRT